MKASQRESLQCHPGGDGHAMRPSPKKRTTAQGRLEDHFFDCNRLLPPGFFSGCFLAVQLSHSEVTWLKQECSSNKKMLQGKMIDESVTVRSWRCTPVIPILWINAETQASSLPEHWLNNIARNCLGKRSTPRWLNVKPTTLVKLNQNNTIDCAEKIAQIL